MNFCNNNKRVLKGITGFCPGDKRVLTCQTVWK